MKLIPHMRISSHHQYTILEMSESEIFALENPKRPFYYHKINVMYQWNSVLCMLILSPQIIKVRNLEKTKQYSHRLTWKYPMFCVCERETTQSVLSDLQKALIDLHNVKITILFHSTWNRKGSRIIWKQ